MRNHTQFRQVKRIALREKNFCLFIFFYLIYMYRDKDFEIKNVY